LSEVQAPSVGDCLVECQQFDGIDMDGDGSPEQVCSFFTYDRISQGCELLANCDMVDDTCFRCLSGSVNCGAQRPKGNVILRK